MIVKPMRIGSLNARSIFKESHHPTRHAFISHLKSISLDLDVLCLQETSTLTQHIHLIPDQLEQFTRFMFPNCSAIITKHVAIICLQPHLSLDSTLVSMDERVVVASILDQHQHMLCRVINTYVPAQRSARQDFLASFMALPFIEEVETGPWLMVGDFNMNLHHHHIVRQNHATPWFDWLNTHFDNCFPKGAPTFKRGDTRSTIDYIYGHHSIMSRMTNASSHFLPSNWTDHSLLTIDITPPRKDFGRGAWRFNPSLLSNEGFITLLDNVIDLFFQEEDQHTTIDSGGSPQARWESFKHLLKCTAQQYSRGSTKRRNHQLTALHDQRNMLLSRYSEQLLQRRSIALTTQLQNLEQQIDTLIQQEAQHNRLRSATRWHEQGERNSKYFYRVIKSRQQQQTIQSLKCSRTNRTLHDSRDLIQETRHFYQQLYTPEEVDQHAIDQLLSNIPHDVKLTPEDANDLTSPLSRLDMLDLIARAPKGKSPGLDGIPFEVYQHIAPRSSHFFSLLLMVLRQAFDGVFPESWCKTRMVLLFKKGDPELLANWRPLSLINADAKLFTKLIANRVNSFLPRLINPYQTGFMPHRLISDNGWINQVLMTNARHTSSSSSPSPVAVFLDQEKAYDRVHPVYLRRVLRRFGFPDSITHSLSTLFFGTQIHVSINGWLGSPFIQGCGLRQGDPLSPLLFNLAFEPLLRSLLASSLRGVSLKSFSLRPQYKANPAPVHYYDTDWEEQQHLDPLSQSLSTAPPNIKLLSYADDLEVFLDDPREWAILLDLLLQYRQASNAKVNLTKTVMMPLSGGCHEDWLSLATSFGSQWHDANSNSALRYLGYPLYHTQAQLLDYLSGIKGKISRHANILKGRSLSIRGAGMVANFLLLSKLWHIMRVIPVPPDWFKEVTGIIRSFMLPFFPTPRWSTICMPRCFGGAGVVDLEHQRLALHYIYIQRLCKQLRSTDFVSAWIIRYFQLLTGHASILPWLCSRHLSTLA